MIFGGYGKKRKHRGDVIYPCVECGDALSVHGFVETTATANSMACVSRRLVRSAA